MGFRCVLPERVAREGNQCGVPCPALPWETNSYPIWYTSAAQVEAEVVHVGAGTARDFDRVDVRGKIAMVESVYLINVMNTDGMLDAYESAVAHGAVGYIRTADAPNNLTRLTHGKGIDKNTFRQRKEASIPGLVLGSDDFNAIRTALGGGPVTMSLEIRTENPPSVEPAPLPGDRWAPELTSCAQSWKTSWVYFPGSVTKLFSLARITTAPTAAQWITAPVLRACWR